ncbi:retrovirus-related pol polyprotein from transposon TNT 1-94 [Tanacetum coccineum]
MFTAELVWMGKRGRWGVGTGRGGCSRRVDGRSCGSELGGSGSIACTREAVGGGGKQTWQGGCLKSSMAVEVGRGGTGRDILVMRVANCIPSLTFGEFLKQGGPRAGEGWTRRARYHNNTGGGVQVEVVGGGTGGKTSLVVRADSRTRPPRMLDITDLLNLGKRNGNSGVKKKKVKADIRATNILLQGSEFNKRMTMESQVYNDEFEHSFKTNEKPFKDTYVRFIQPNNDPLALVSDASVQQYPTQPSKSKEPSPADNFQMDSGSSSTENLIESLSNTLALLTQSYKSHRPQTNNQLRASSNARNKAMLQDGKVVVQDVRRRYNATNQGRPFQRNIARGNGVARNVGGEHVTNVDDDVDDSPENDLALNVDHIFEVDECDAFDSDVDEALFKEVKEMEEIFDQMNNEVDKNTVDKQCAKIEKKNLLIENENLIVNCLSTQLLYDVEKSRCLDLEADMSKIKNLEHQIQEKDNVIRHLKDLVANVNDRSREPYNAIDVTALIEQNDCDRVELEKVKRHYKELDYVKPKVLAPGIYAIDVKPIPHPLKNNRSAHLNYISPSKESVETGRTGHALVSGLRMLKTYDGESSKLMNFVGKVHPDILKGIMATNLYTISIDEMMKSSPNCLPVQSIQVQNMDYTDEVENDHLFSACQLGKSNKFHPPPKSKITNMEFLYTLHMTVYGPQHNIRFICTDNGTEFVNQVMSEYYEGVGIFHQKSVPRTPQQNGVVERRNRILVEAARTMMIFSKVFGALCYPTNDSENLGKFQAKADIGIFVGYAPSRKGYRIYNKRTRRLMETIHVTLIDKATVTGS